ncbi:unnamed protein product, partial [Ilex paraguariensis]
QVLFMVINFDWFCLIWYGSHYMLSGGSFGIRVCHILSLDAQCCCKSSEPLKFL